MPSNTLVIGDTHGHLDRLEALLEQEGIIEDGARVNTDVKVIHLGDVAHNGSGRSSNMYASSHLVPGNKTADMLTWSAVIKDRWCDVALMGNHDAAVFDKSHEFGGYIRPKTETEHIMKLALQEDRLKLATEAHGFLLTHAGLHKVFASQKHVPAGTKTDPRLFAEWMNDMQDQDETEGLDYDLPDVKDFVAIRDAIGKKRGGFSPVGGILWRDATEKLYGPFRQVFGHTKGDKVRRYETQAGWSYCVDVGDQFNGRLAGIWLPEERIVEVKL